MIFIMPGAFPNARIHFGSTLVPLAWNRLNFPPTQSFELPPDDREGSLWGTGHVSQSYQLSAPEGRTHRTLVEGLAATFGPSRFCCVLSNVAGGGDIWSGEGRCQ